MAKSYHNDIYDNGLNAAKTNGNKMVLCKQPPASYTDANNLPTDTPAGYKIAEVAMASGDYTVQDKAGGGRECAVAAKAGVTALAGSLGSDDLHIAVLDTVNSKLLVLTDETTNQPVTQGNAVNIPSWKFYFTPPV